MLKDILKESLQNEPTSFVNSINRIIYELSYKMFHGQALTSKEVQSAHRELSSFLIEFAFPKLITENREDLCHEILSSLDANRIHLENEKGEILDTNTLFTIQPTHRNIQRWGKDFIVQFAEAPHLSFVNSLIELATEELPLKGDRIVVYLENSEVRGIVIKVLDDFYHVKKEDGEVEIFHVDEWLVVEERPSINALWEQSLRYSQPDGVAYAEGIRPKLREKLLKGFEVLMQEEPDYHPGSGTKVRDLAHPSLYPFVNTSTNQSPSKHRFFSNLFSTSKITKKENQKPEKDFWGRPYEDSKFQWLPSDFKIDSEGKVQILGEINNIQRKTNEDFYTALSELFESFLPLFESVYGYIDATDFFMGGDESELNESIEVSPISPRSLKKRKVQVITKVIEYALEEEEVFEGVWHVEGMSHENILATGVYTLQRDKEFHGGTLRFKRGYTNAEASTLFWNISQVRPEQVDTIVERGVVPIGSVETKDDRLIVFPNSHIHKVSAMSSMKGRATRRVIVFWLIHPEYPILGMNDVPKPQNQMTREEAMNLRLELMEERRVHKQSQNVRAISLCEH